MSNILEHTPEILIAVTIMFFLWGVGYMMLSTDEKAIEFKKYCIDSGMQYVSGSCTK